MSSVIFEMKNLSFSYPNVQESIFEDFSLQLARRGSLSVLGSSGCGKSTLLKLIFGVLKPSAGEVSLLAKNPMYLGQEESLIPWKSVMYNLLLPYRLNREKVNAHTISDAHILLEQVGLLAYKKKPVYQLSLGMRKRVELARCLLKRPDFLLMDEPFAALDPAHREAMLLLCKNLEKKYGFASVFITHNIEDGVFWGERVIVLERKKSTEIVYDHKLEKANQKEFKLNLIEEKSYEDIHKILFEYEKKDSPLIQKSLPKKKHLWGMMLGKVSPVMLLMSLLALLFLAKAVLKWPNYLMPWPSEIFNLFIETLANKSIQPHVQETLSISIVSFVCTMIITLITGYFLAHFKTFRNLTMPLIVLFNTIPIVALAPFLLLWVGISPITKIIITSLIMIFPLLLVTEQAFTIGQEQTQLHRAYLPGKKLNLFFYLEWRYAFPTLLIGWKTALGTSIIGTVVAEFVMGNQGLGALINVAKSRFDTPLMFVGLIWLILIGLAYFEFFSCIQKIYQRTTAQ